jgi:hypothetical protein
MNNNLLTLGNEDIITFGPFSANLEVLKIFLGEL